MHFQEKKQKQQKKRRKEQEAQKTKEEEVARGNMFNSPLHNTATASDDDIPRSQINGDMTLPTSHSSPLQSLLLSETLGDRVSDGGDKSVLPPVPKSRSIEAYGSTFEPGNLQNGTNGLKFGATHVVASVSRLEPLESGMTFQSLSFKSVAILFVYAIETSNVFFVGIAAAMLAYPLADHLQCRYPLFS